MKRFFCFILILVLCACPLMFLGCSKDEISAVAKNLSNYTIEAKLNYEDKTISAKQTLDYVNNTGTNLQKIYFHLYPRAFRKGAMVKPYSKLNEATCFPNGESYGDIEINSVKVSGNDAEFCLVGQDEDILEVVFGYELPVNKRALIEINFLVTIPNSTHRLGYFENNINIGNWYPIVCGFSNGEFDLSPYYATGDPFFSDIANYNVMITLPKDFEIVSTGDENDCATDEQTKTIKICASAVRDFAFCLSLDSKIETEQSSTGVSVNYMSCLDDDEILNIVHLARDAVEFFSRIFGNYPYKSLTIAKTPFLYGGMEYPNLVFVSNSLESKEDFYKVVVHEIAHQWWYALVGNNEVKEAWLDESLSEYSAALFFKNYPEYGISYDEFISQAMSSYMLYVDVISTIRGDVNTKMNLAVNEYQNDYEYSYMVYIKGVIMFDSLKSMVGENKVISGLKKYFSDNKFKIASKENFYKAFSDACHRDLNGFFDSYLNGTVIISNIN